MTGSRSFKFGYTGTMLGVLNLTNRSGNNLQYRVNNGVPNQLTEFINNFEQKLWMRNDAFFAQEQWTIDRLTLQGALRYDHSWSWAPAQHIGPERFLPTPLDFAEGLVLLRDVHLVEAKLLAVLAGASLAFLVGLVDDVLGSRFPVWAKALGQVMAALLVILAGVRTSFAPNDALNVGITLLWLVGITNRSS